MLLSVVCIGYEDLDIRRRKRENVAGWATYRRRISKDILGKQIKVTRVAEEPRERLRLRWLQDLEDDLQ